MKPFKLMDLHVALQALQCWLAMFLLMVNDCESSGSGRMGEMRRIGTEISPSMSDTATALVPTVLRSRKFGVKLKNMRIDEETRTKRQLFREDIPQHRPLSGNTHALQYGFPLPGRFSGNPGNGGNTNQLNDENFPEQPQHGQYPPTIVHDHHTVIYDHNSPEGGEDDHHQHQHHPVSLEHGNEIVHQYPVEIGQYIQLDHDIKSEAGPEAGHGPSTVDIHPSQVDYTQPPSKPELSVEGEVAGHGHEEEPPVIPYGVGHSPHGGHYYSYAAGLHPYSHYHGYGPPGHGPRLKLVHLLKTWPLLFTHKMRRTFWPYRRYRPKIKHHHHYF